MNPTLIIGIVGGFITVGLAAATALIRIGRVLQRVDAVEKAQGTPCPAVQTLQQQMRATEARLKDLEADRKEHGESLSELRGEIKGLRESMDRLHQAMRDLANAVRSSAP